jgi:hypothetical protein
VEGTCRGSLTAHPPGMDADGVNRPDSAKESEIDGFPPRFFELIGRIVYSAAKLEYSLTELAIYLSGVSAPPSDRITALQTARVRLGGQPGTALTRVIQEMGCVRLTTRGAEEFQGYLNSVRAALEVRHKVVHNSWQLFDYATDDPSIVGLRHLPAHKRLGPGESVAGAEFTIEQLENNLNQFNLLLVNSRYWLRELKILKDLDIATRRAQSE